MAIINTIGILFCIFIVMLLLWLAFKITIDVIKEIQHMKRK